MEQNLVGYLLKALDPAAQRDVETYIASNPEAQNQLEILRKALAPLEADRDEYEVPPLLAVRTIGHIAEYIVRHEGTSPSEDDQLIAKQIRQITGASAPPVKKDAPQPAPRSEPTSPKKSSSAKVNADRPLAGGAPNAWRDLIAGIGLAIAFFGVAVPGIVGIRSHQQQLRCQNNMREYYQALVGFSDHNNQHFPQIGENETAGSVATVLHRAGYLPGQVELACPSTGEKPKVGQLALVNYAYTLGYREEGHLMPATRSQGDLYALLSDAPVRKNDITLAKNHRRGNNVLFCSGNVRFCTDPHVGLDQDDIFSNSEGKIGAGLSAKDSVLGRPEEMP